MNIVQQQVRISRVSSHCRNDACLNYVAAAKWKTKQYNNKMKRKKKQHPNKTATITNRPNELFIQRSQLTNDLHPNGRERERNKKTMAIYMKWMMLVFYENAFHCINREDQVYLLCLNWREKEILYSNTIESYSHNFNNLYIYALLLTTIFWKTKNTKIIFILDEVLFVIEYLIAKCIEYDLFPSIDLSSIWIVHQWF